MRALTAAPTASDLRAKVERLDGAAAAGRLAVAVSGGADSLALLKLAAQAFPGRLEAITVDHGLRAESAEEAERVRAIAATLGVPHAILRLDQPLQGPGLQAAAREARYRAMAKHGLAMGIGALLTAHHADDQAETLLMRLNRSSGLSGLAGIRERQQMHGLLVLRPLLGVRRRALRLVLEGTPWPIAEDPANVDERFDRARARRLLARGGLDAKAAARSATCLADAEAALLWVVDRAWDSRITMRRGECRLDLEGLPDEISRRLLIRAFDVFHALPRGEAVARLLERGGGTLCGMRATAKGGQWRLVPAPARRRQGS